MSYLVQNYFNNFQIRNPLVKNPINRAPPVQLTKVRPGVLPSGETVVQVALEDMLGSCLKLTEPTQSSVYLLPTADDLLKELGQQSNGLPTATWNVVTQVGDCLLIPVINKGATGTVRAGGSASTGSVQVGGGSGDSYHGNVKTVTVEFTNVSPGANGVTGAYVIY